MKKEKVKSASSMSLLELSEEGILTTSRMTCLRFT
jgi:hypothetical protein